MIKYFSKTSNSKLVLWCYLILWVSTVFHHFDPSLSIWLNSLGLSIVIGLALILSVGGFSTVIQNRWQTFRLFAMPFCVSSFSSLIKGKNFILIFTPSAKEALTSFGLILVFISVVLILRKLYR